MRYLPLLRRLNSCLKHGLMAATACVVLTAAARAATADFPTLLAQAKNGDSQSQFNVGLAYELGRGVAADDKQAFTYYLQAAEQGYPPAQFNVGNMYAKGRGTAQDYFEANLWYKQAADNGIVEAQFNLGFAYEAGNGVLKDPAQAALWYQLAAEHGYAQAQYNLGLLHEDGRGVAKDFVAAAALYRAAADQGFAPAQVNYGLMLAEGRPGVTADPVLGYAWLSRAVLQGFGREAREALGRNLTPEQIAAAERQIQAARPGRAETTAGVSASVATVAATPPAPVNPPAENLVDQLRDQNRRLAAQVEALSTEKEASERQNAVLTSQLKDLRQVASGTAAASKPVPTDAAITAATLATLQRDNVRLNDEVKRSTLELLSLNNQLRALRDQPSRVEEAAPDQQTAAQLAKLREEFRQAREALATSQSQLTSLQQEKSEQDKWARTLEQTLNEKTAEGTRLADENQSLRTRLARAEEPTKTKERPAANPEAEAWQRQLAEANQALEKSGATVAELTAANEKLERDLAAATQPSAETKALREENAHLRDEAAVVEAWRTKASQLTRDNEELTGFMNGNRRDLGKAQAKIAELEKQLTDALTVRTRGEDAGSAPPSSDTGSVQLVAQLQASVAELTRANDKLEKDLENAQKTSAAALAAQSQAVKAASPDAFQMEISTLNVRIKELEAQLEEERSGAAREVSTLASQLQKARETNKSLTEANRALLSTKESDVSAEREEAARLADKLRDLTAANEGMRRDTQKQAADLQSLTTVRDDLQAQLQNARKASANIKALADENATLQERAEAAGTRLAQLEREQEALQKANTDLGTRLAASQLTEEKARTELASIQAQATEADKAAEAHNASVAELTQVNGQLEKERDELRRQYESSQSEIQRLGQSVKDAEQQRADAQKGAQQNVDAVAAQLAQLRHELDASRANQTRLSDNYATQERERTATIAQLRSDNAALSARLTQAQSTLDQIASAARLGTPAATLAAGGSVPSRPVPAASTEMRFHTVIDGDSLSRISMRYYGTTNRWQEIYQANREVLQGSNALRVGMQLRIP